MKKIVVLFFVAFLAAPSVKAQSETETREWLQAKVASLINDEYFPVTFKYTYVRIVTTYNTNSKAPLEWTDVMYDDISSISYSKTDAGFYKIIIAGKDFMSEKSGMKSSESFFVRGDESSAQKIVKALTHLATLNGARLIKDDLF